MGRAGFMCDEEVCGARHRVMCIARHTCAGSCTHVRVFVFVFMSESTAMMLFLPLRTCKDATLHNTSRTRSALSILHDGFSDRLCD